MWSNLLKLLAFLFFNRQLQSLKSKLRNLRHDVADYTEDRAQQLKQDFVEETERLASSLVGILLVFSMLIFTGLLGLMWLFSVLWDHPQRSLILGLAMLIPALIAVAVFWSVRRMWKRKPLFASSLALISSDWQLFRSQMGTQHSEAPDDQTHTNTPANANTPAQSPQQGANPAPAAAEGTPHP